MWSLRINVLIEASASICNKFRKRNKKGFPNEELGIE